MADNYTPAPAPSKAEFNTLSQQVSTLNGKFALVQNISVSPNSYTDVDYPDGFSQYHTMIISCVIADIYTDFTNISFIFNASKIRVTNPTTQSWIGVKLLLYKI